MIKLTSLFLAIALTTQCSQDETLRAYGAADRLWRLQELNGVPFSTNTQLSFPEKEQVTVQGPCNRMSGTNKLPYPWFSVNLRRGPSGCWAVRSFIECPYGRTRRHPPHSSFVGL
ncbi:META domain-containing protein [Sulfitobacter sp. SK025]|uniref:META domain-containing protein n=1 Tax=Sulfitobacter sp. SK025 TaxID=1389011 RepID=UPI0020C8094B|nr:META domain-containing protein [Sulfitobacter sp. SK025]